MNFKEFMKYEIVGVLILLLPIFLMIYYSPEAIGLISSLFFALFSIVWFLMLTAIFYKLGEIITKRKIKNITVVVLIGLLTYLIIILLLLTTVFYNIEGVELTMFSPILYSTNYLTFFSFFSMYLFNHYRTLYVISPIAYLIELYISYLIGKTIFKLKNKVLYR